MEFSNARSGKKRTEKTLPWAKAPPHSISHCATKQPGIWRKSERKKIWQWRDCSPTTSHPTISNPLMGCAGIRQTWLRFSSSGQQPQRQGGKDPLFSRRPRSHTRRAAPRTLSQGKSGGSGRRCRPAPHLVSFLHKEPKASDMDQLLAFSPTTCLLL